MKHKGLALTENENITELVEEAIQRTRDYLLQRQHPAGYWKGQLEADASVTAGYIPLMYFMGLTVPLARIGKIVATMKKSRTPTARGALITADPGTLA